MVGFILLLIVACGSQGEKTGSYNFKQGVGELQFRFLENAPPEKIYPNSNFKIVLEADNLAAYDVVNLQVAILGLDQTYFEISPSEQKVERLVGRSLTAPGRDKQFLEFEGQSKSISPQAFEYRAPFFLKTEYRSTFEFVDTICLNPNVYAIYDAGCKPDTQKSFSGQGAPVGVNRMEEIISPGAGAKVEFRLFITNLGKGKVKTLTVGKGELGGKPLLCVFQRAEDPTGKKVQLGTEAQEATLICTASLEDSQSYKTTLAVDFSYDYEFIEPQELALVR